MSDCQSRSPGPDPAGQVLPKRSYRFPRQLRITRRADFQRVLREGLRAADPRLTVWLLPNGRPYPRLGLMLTRQHGTAVRRNRLKRLIREAFRLKQHDLPAGFDLLCVPRVGSELELPECMESLERLSARLAGRLRGS